MLTQLGYLTDSKTRSKPQNRMAERYDKYKKRFFDEYTSHDLVFYFQERYEQLIGEPYRISFVKDSTQMSRLVECYGLFAVINLIEYSLRYKSPMSIGMLSSGWSNTWYGEMIKKYGTSQDTLKYRCLLLLDLPQLLKREIVWRMSQVEEGKTRKDWDYVRLAKRKLEDIYDNVKDSHGTN